MAVRIIGAARSAIMIGPPPQRTVLFNGFHADAEGLVAAIEELLTAV